MQIPRRERSFRRSLARALIVGAVALAAAPGASPTTLPAGDETELPGYYQWYQRSGDLATLREEAQRDSQMEAGTLAPEALESPAPALTFKTPDGADWLLADHVGGGYTILVPFQSWW